MLCGWWARNDTSPIKSPRSAMRSLPSECVNVKLPERTIYNSLDASPMVNSASPSKRNLGFSILTSSCMRSGSMLLKNDELPMDCINSVCCLCLFLECWEIKYALLRKYPPWLLSIWSRKMNISPPPMSEKSKVTKWWVSVLRSAKSALAKATTVGETSSIASAEIKAPAPKPHMAPTVPLDIGVVMPTMAPNTMDPAAMAPRMAAHKIKVFPISVISTPLVNTLQVYGLKLVNCQIINFFYLNATFPINPCVTLPATMNLLAILFIKPTVSHET